MQKQTIEQKTFYEHVRELRKRITWAALAFMIGGLLGYINRVAAISFLQRPLHQALYYNNPAGGFNLVMEVSAICGLLVSIPVLSYQLVRFLAPAWGDSIRAHHVFIITAISAILAAAGAFFGYFVMLPLSLHFFSNFDLGNVHALIVANTYIDFVVKCIITFIIVFQIPLIILFINRIKPLSPRKMIKWEKYVIVGSLGLAVVLPFTYDPVSQFILAAPIILLYNLALVMIVWTNGWNKHKTRKVQKRTAKKASKQIVDLEPEPVVAPKPVVIAPIVAAKPKSASATVVGQDISRPQRQTVRRMVDITLPRNHAVKSSNYLDLRNVTPKPNVPPALELGDA